MDTQPALSDEQERMRLEGLRILARIIASHALAHPGLYGNCSDGGAAEPARLDDRANADGTPNRTDDAD